MTTRNRSYALLALAGLALAGCGSAAQEAGKTTSISQPVAVRAAPVTETTLARPIIAAGTVAPKDKIALSFKAGGVIAQVAVDPGDVVRAGQILATLDLR